MALVALIIFLPWLGAVALLWLRPMLGRYIGRWALLPPAASFLITLTFVSSVSRGQSFLYALPWFPDLGVTLSFWLDGLNVFFALLIAGTGLLITWYSHYHLDPSERSGRYFAYPMLFMGAMLGLVLAGAGAKSAQVPLHFWLPNAMAAPTPVSAYLHSATTVKAGLFLVCRMLPMLGGSTAWMSAVTVIGLVTFLVGGIFALRQYDLKALLALICPRPVSPSRTSEG